MACTIDHLRVDHRVTVLRDFTDLAGVAVRAGESGVLRGLGLDHARMELWIELERNDTRAKLRFPLRATDGPRNGHMKEFFQIGESIDTRPPAPPPTIEPPPPKGPKRPPATLLACAGTQAPDNTSLAETSVACDCDPGFHRPLLPARGELSVNACLRCGTVTCSRSFGDDGRFTGNAWSETRTVLLAGPVHEWIAQWPRVKVDHAAADGLWPMSADFIRYPTLYYPGDTRCDDLAQLAALEARLAREQSAQSPAERLRATQRVTSPPPAGVPAELQGYVMLWRALQLQPDSELADLFHLAQLRSPGSAVAAEVLRRRPDAFELMVHALRGGDATTRGVGFAIARDLRPADPRLAGILIEILNGLSVDPLPNVPGRVVSWDQFEMILLLIAELKLATPEILATLRALMRKLARHDTRLAGCVRVVLHELDPTACAAPLPFNPLP
jgi:hypothetical protein